MPTSFGVNPLDKKKRDWKKENHSTIYYPYISEYNV